MVSVQQVEKGLAAYIDNEMLPNLPRDGIKGFGVGVAATLLIKRGGGIIQQLASNKIVQQMGLVAPDGSVDLDAVQEACVVNMPNTGVPVALPFGMTIRIKPADIDKICDYIRRA